MTHARLAHLTLAIALLFGASACKEPPGTADTGRSADLPQPGHVRLVEYPVDAVDLGQGWHEEQAVKAVATCIDFRPLADTGQEQTMRISVVTDRSDLMDQLEISAEVQVKAIAYSVSGKASYAQAVEIKAESLNFVAHARVDNGVEYAAPADVAGLKRIDLTPHYRDLARRDLGAFERECGDGFVSAIHAGAELTAILSFAEQSTTERKELEAAMKGSGWGFSAKGQASAKMDHYAGKSKLTISYHQTGGQGNPIPTDQAGFLQAIQRLPALAAQDGVNYRIRVQSYRSLPGYPTVAEKKGSFHGELAASYGRLASLRDDAVEILESLESPEIDSKTKKVAPGDDYVDFRPDPVARMRALHDELTARLREMTQFAAACSHLNDPPQRELSEQCRLPSALRETNDYHYRIRLPVLRTQTANSTGEPTAAQRKDAIIEQYVRSVSRRRCARDVGDRGCLLESEIAALRASLDEQEKQAPAAPGLLR
ncbi:MAG TPA: hypothetical protein VLD36_14975 [Burkholderiales bacterium]|nr:hypothetical protein [Burkholderiales bacterium]